MTPDDALDLLLEWPVVVVVLDGYEPRLAPHILNAVSSIQDEKIFSVMFTVWNYEARELVNRN